MSLTLPPVLPSPPTLPGSRESQILSLLMPSPDAPPLWTPIPDSPQQCAYESPANIIGFGGGAGGGK